jgi:VCBS repeat-containing protein
MKKSILVLTIITGLSFLSPQKEALAVNNPPAANAQAVVAEGDTGLPIALTGSDPDGDPLTFQVVTQPANGILSGTAPDDLTYQPDSGYQGRDSFQFKVNDGQLDSTVAQVYILVDAVNGLQCPANNLILKNNVVAPGEVVDETFRNNIIIGPDYEVQSGGTLTLTSRNIVLLPGFNAQEGSNFNLNAVTWEEENTPPVVIDDFVTVDEGASINANVLTNDIDWQCDSVSASLINSVSHGTLVLNSDGSFTYDHDDNESSTDSFTYQAIDTEPSSSNATVTIIINPVNDAPVANNDVYTIDMDTSHTFRVLANDIDTDYGDVISVTSFSTPTPSNGSLLTNNGDSITYTPAAGFVGQEEFTYTTQDTSGESTTATVTVKIVNNPSCASGGGLALQNQIITSGQVVDETVRNSITVGPAYEIQSGATVTLNSYTISLLPGFSAQDGSAVHVFTSPWNDLNANPIAEADSATVNEGGSVSVNVLTNDRDLDCDSLTANLLTDVIHGTLAPNTDGSFTYDHDGSETTNDSFTYQAMDAESSNTVTVSITVIPVNEAPVAKDDRFVVYEYTSHALDVLTNDSDPDPGDHAAFTIASVNTLDNHGTVTINGRELIYTPAMDYVGKETFGYTIEDPGGLSSTATATVFVGNVAPVAHDKIAVTDEFEPVTITLSANDADNDPLTYLITIDPANGTLSGTPPNVTYTSDVVPSGQDSFTYSVSDHINTDFAKVTITVNIVEKVSMITYEYDALGRIKKKVEGLLPVRDSDNDGVLDHIENIVGTDPLIPD